MREQYADVGAHPHCARTRCTATTGALGQSKHRATTNRKDRQAHKPARAQNTTAESFLHIQQKGCHYLYALCAKYPHRVEDGCNA